jgi:hypothetical protein
VTTRGRGHQAARHHERLFVGDGHRLARLDGGHGREEASATHDSGEDHIGVELTSHGHEPALTTQDLRARMTERAGERVHRALVGDRHCAGPMGTAKFRHHLGIRALGGKPLDAELLGEASHELEGAAPNGAGGAENRHALHAWSARP